MVDNKNEVKQSIGQESFVAREAAVEAPQAEIENAEGKAEARDEKKETVNTIKKFFRRRPDPAHFLPTFQDPVTQKIEKILEEDVGDAYSRLSPIAKEEFKLKGEATAKAITELMKSTHVKVKKIFRLIFEWLKMLPGINRFFLEQEAKIKTDRILAIRDRK